MFVKSELSILQQRMAAPRQFMQVILVPRQVGKTTLVRQLVSTLTVPFVAAYAVPSPNSVWIRQRCQLALFQLFNSSTSECV